MTVIDKVSIIKSIKHQTLEANSFDDFLGVYQLINNSLAQEKDKLETLSIDLIIVENIYGDYDKLENHRIVLQKNEREVIHIFTFGDFTQDS